MPEKKIWEIGASGWFYYKEILWFKFLFVLVIPLFVPLWVCSVYRRLKRVVDVSVFFPPRVAVRCLSAWAEKSFGEFLWIILL